MPVSKIWNVLSDNPRPSHAAIDGDEEDFADPFANGLYYPGDPDGDADETAGCTCVMTIAGSADTAELPPEADGPPEASGDLLGLLVALFGAQSPLT